MGFNVTQLIEIAYNQANIAPINYTPLSPDQLKLGLYSLNQMLGQVSIDDGLIPYWKDYEGTFVVNQETYEIPNLINIQTFTFILNENVRYPIYPDNYRDYWGSTKPLNIQTLPGVYSLIRDIGGSKVSITPSPDKAYPFTIRGAFGLLDAGYNDDLSEIYDQYYITYLTALTARMICINSSMAIPPQLELHIKDYDTKIRNKSQPLDLTNTYTSVFDGGSTFNYMQAYVGKGYIASSRKFYR